MQLTNVEEPFGEVNVYKQPAGEFNIVATILTVPDLEGVRMGIALDGSASMKKMYGVSGIVGGAFATATSTPNFVEPVARTMVSYLANFSPYKVNVIYWACSPDGSQVEELGDFNDLEIQNVAITGPKKLPWGRGTRLLPPLKYFIDKFKGTQEAKDIGVKQPAAICVFVTDGIIEDLADVKQYCFQYAQEISNKQKPFMKLLLIGVGEEVDKGQMEELDNMLEGSGIKDSSGQNVDFWDHQLASDINKLEQVFKELVSEDVIAFSSGRVLDQSGKICKEYADGVPALLRFTLPPGSNSFTLEVPGGSVTQDISEALSQP